MVMSHGVLEAARVFSLETGRTVRCPYARKKSTVGHRHHVEQILAEPKEFVGLINFEMIGYTDTQDGSQGAPIR